MVALSPGVASAQEGPGLPLLCFAQQGDPPVVYCPLDVINLLDFGDFGDSDPNVAANINEQLGFIKAKRAGARLAPALFMPPLGLVSSEASVCDY